jgi:hypothetical protein
MDESNNEQLRKLARGYRRWALNETDPVAVRSLSAFADDLEAKAEALEAQA